MRIVDVLAHLRYRRFLDAHVDHELSDVFATRVATHVASCPRCAREADLAMVVKSHLALHRFLPPRPDRDRGCST
ncbi:MAG: zf-HC2 domain-containing protein [Acidimicrobiales bacterium]|nr:zf-HC2 domain-containing protein [Acidimicrobiales bacterium]